MKEYDIFVPIAPKRERQLALLKKQLAMRFGGLTFFPQKNEGLWKFGGVTFKDEIVIIRVLAKDSHRASLYMQRLKTQLRKTWKQKEVLIIARDVEVV